MRYTEVYHAVYSCARRARVGITKKMLRGAERARVRDGVTIVKNVRTFLETQRMGIEIATEVARFLREAADALDKRIEIAARRIQRAVLRWLYRPPGRGATVQTSFLLRQFCAEF